MDKHLNVDFAFGEHKIVTAEAGMDKSEVLVPKTHKFSPWKLVENQAGRIGYVIAWLFGVPASLLFVIFLIRGH
jgi:hypothetical protein